MNCIIIKFYFAFEYSIYSFMLFWKLYDSWMQLMNLHCSFASFYTVLVRDSASCLSSAARRVRPNLTQWKWNQAKENIVGFSNPPPSLSLFLSLRFENKIDR